VSRKAVSSAVKIGIANADEARFAISQMSLQLAKIIYLFDMKLLESSKDWKSNCRVHFFWWKPSLNVRFWPRSDEVMMA
jgi:hypothetical protein